MLTNTNLLSSLTLTCEQVAVSVYSYQIVTHEGIWFLIGSELMFVMATILIWLIWN